MIKELKILNENSNIDKKINFKKIKSNKYDYFEISSRIDSITISYTSKRSKSYALSRLEEIGRDKTFELVDFADIKTRGVIEGFYSIPWSNDQRRDMLEFMDKVFLNTYIYAPKDDPYHNKKWREKYDSKSLEDLKKLVNLANKLDIDFVWSIHPGMNKFDFNRYDEELKVLIDKYRSLMDIGIKNFALFMDDIDRNEAYENRENHTRLYKDVDDFLASNNMGHLMVVLPFYNQAWVDEKAKEYFDGLRGTQIEIMWTGREVLSPIDDEANKFFKEISGKQANIWLNWPVNDYMRDSIFLESFEYFNASRDKTFKSLFTNPMNQEELSKISVAQVADFLWDMSNYDVKKSLEHAFNLVEKNHNLYEISDSFYSSQLYKDNENPLIIEDEAIYDAYKREDFESLKKLVVDKIKKTEDYLDNYSNPKLYEEIHVFIKNLNYILKAIKCLLDKDVEEADREFQKTKGMKIWIYKEYTDHDLVERKVKNPERLTEIYENLRRKL